MNKSLSPQSTMREVLAQYPGAQRALFRRYHIGGCASCSFQLTETVAGVCERNGGLNPQGVLAGLAASHAEDEQVLVSPAELKVWMEKDLALRLVDVRSREEFEAVHIPGSILLSQPAMREILAEGTNDRPIVIVDHQGKNGLDAAAYFAGHGLKQVRCLRGGIDAWSREVDPSMRRYEIS